ncbi:TetR/AcrR family transcriptional regulator [Nocardioides pacificus]
MAKDRSGHVGTRGMPRAEREAQILDAAMAEFGERGYHQASVDAIAARAGISKPLVHAYFGTKELLNVRCVESLTELLLEVIVPVVDGGAEPGMTMALETMRTIFETLRERPQDWMVLYDVSLPAGTPVHAAATLCRDRMTELGAVGARAALSRHAGDEVDPLEASMMNHVWQSVVTSLMTWWFEHPEQTPAELTARFGRVLSALTDV